AENATALANQLGFVGVQELTKTTWLGLARFFGVQLEPLRINVTRSRRRNPPVPTVNLVTRAALELIEQRSAADRQVFRAIVSHVLGGDDDVDRLSEWAFSTQLARLQTVASDF